MRFCSCNPVNDRKEVHALFLISYLITVAVYKKDGDGFGLVINDV